MKKLFRFICMILTVVMLATSLNLSVFADTSFSHTVFSGEKKIEGWYPAFITQWIDANAMASFIEAIQHDGATIEVTYKGSSKVSLLLQSYNIKDGGHYPHASLDKHTLKKSGDKQIAVFSCADLIKNYTSRKHDDDGSYLKLDKVMNFGIGGENNVVYSVVVKWTVKGDPGITFNIDKTYQTMDGWGASYTWYSDWLTNNIHKEQVYDWIFKDCGFNILRFRDLNKVRAYGGGYESLEYKSYKAYYDAAVKRGIDPIVLVTSWGQYDRKDCKFVAFVEKDDQGHSYYTLAKDKNGNYMYNELANFCVQSVKYFLDAGIPVDYFSISNETELQGLGKDENGNARSEAGFFFGAEENKYHCAYWKAHVAVYKAFKKAFGDKAPKITGAEVMADTASLIKSYISPIEKNAPESMEIVAHHLYGSANTKTSFAEAYEVMKDYKIWQTEWYSNDFFGNANTIINELNYENINAYLYWNGVWIPDEANCLIEIGDWPANAYVKRRGNHYIMMHFSKFIKQGYKRVDLELNAVSSNVTAFVSPDNTELVLVALNNTSSDEKLRLNPVGYKIKSGKIYRSTKNTDDYTKEEKLNKYMEDKGYIKTYSIELPKNTLTTLVMKITPREEDKTETSTAKK